MIYIYIYISFRDIENQKEIDFFHLFKDILNFSVGQNVKSIFFFLIFNFIGSKIIFYDKYL